MKPSDSPDFFNRPPPEGRSRESTLRLDASGRFWHAGELIEHRGIAAGLHRWIGRHPDDGRYILCNGYDWTYFKVDDAPYFVAHLSIDANEVALALSDGSQEAWEPATSWVGEDDAVRALVKSAAARGPYEAKFSPHAQASLSPILEEMNGQIVVRIGGQRIGLASGRSVSPPLIDAGARPSPLPSRELADARDKERH